MKQLFRTVSNSKYGWNSDILNMARIKTITKISSKTVNI